jgi:hypothetical protein
MQLRGLDNHIVVRSHTKRRHEWTGKEREELAKGRRKDHGQMAMDTLVDETVREIQDFRLVSTSPRYDTRSIGDWFFGQWCQTSYRFFLRPDLMRIETGELTANKEHQQAESRETRFPMT